jgi:hypothetical protein
MKKAERLDASQLAGLSETEEFLASDARIHAEVNWQGREFMRRE